ncbi:ester cyclase [Micromonospora sp. HM5-17]|jgi:hypothetical protein|uniref:ester cyclase n=1 Tax=Micromonospora sp. HM5-17 TaxID=2487710 RepID=UPI0013152208|nr:nuclear transport factor 2 family protein [Micromonospora sp. HM5-17]
MTINTNHSPVLVAVDPRPRLWANWMALRNGDLSLVEEVVAPDLAVHLPLADGNPVRLRGRAEFASWVSALHAAHPGLRFTVEVGPIIGPDLIAGRWTCVGFLRPGGYGPGPVDAVAGVDIIRIDGERIVECWSHDDARAGLDRPVACAAA